MSILGQLSGHLVCANFFSSQSNCLWVMTHMVHAQLAHMLAYMFAYILMLSPSPIHTHSLACNIKESMRSMYTAVARKKEQTHCAAETPLESKQASPGPCYNPSVSLVNSKHANSGSFSFGVGGRTAMYTVRF